MVDPENDYFIRFWKWLTEILIRCTHTVPMNTALFTASKHLIYNIPLIESMCCKVHHTPWNLCRAMSRRQAVITMDAVHKSGIFWKFQIFCPFSSRLFIMLRTKCDQASTKALKRAFCSNHTFLRRDGATLKSPKAQYECVPRDVWLHGHFQVVLQGASSWSILMTVFDFQQQWAKSFNWSFNAEAGELYYDPGNTLIGKKPHRCIGVSNNLTHKQVKNDSWHVLCWNDRQIRGKKATNNLFTHWTGK